MDVLNQPIAISGAGCVLATGLGTAPLWQAACESSSGIGALRATHFHSKRVKAFGQVDAAVQQQCRQGIARNLLRYAAPPVFWGVNAVQQALAEAGLDPQNSALRFGLFCCQGGYTHPSLDAYAALLRECGDSHGLDPKRLAQRILTKGALDPFLVLKSLSNGLLGIVSLTYRIEGEANAYMEGVSGNQAALRAACSALLDQRIDVAIVAAAGSELDALGLSALVQAGVISAEGAEVFRPFDLDGHGGIAGEGAAALILRRSEDLPDAAQTRLVGIGSNTAMTDLRASPLPLDLLVCGGSAMPEQDRQLCELLKPLRAAHVTSGQPLTGILSAAPSLVDLILARCALQAQQVPPMAGLQRPVAQGVDFVTGSSRSARLQRATVINADTNGFSACYHLDYRGEQTRPDFSS